MTRSLFDIDVIYLLTNLIGIIRGIYRVVLLTHCQLLMIFQSLLFDLLKLLIVVDVVDIYSDIWK